MHTVTVNVNFKQKETCKWIEKDGTTEIPCISKDNKNYWKYCPFCGKELRKIKLERSIT
jgi:hypothetical protein